MPDELEVQKEKTASTAEMLRDLEPVLKLGDDIGTMMYPKYQTVG